MPLLKKTELGHWEFSRSLDPDKHFGFVYCITNEPEQRFYIGRKNFATGGKKTRKHPKTGKRIPNLAFGKDTKWRDYMGSSVDLGADIKRLGKDSFKFQIVDVYNTYGGLYYAEAYTQMCTESMTKKLKEGRGLDCFRFYNRQVAPVRFRPQEEPTKKTRQFIKKLEKDILNGT